jgi:hypothetical protein
MSLLLHCNGALTEKHAHCNCVLVHGARGTGVRRVRMAYGLLLRFPQGA